MLQKEIGVDMSAVDSRSSFGQHVVYEEHGDVSVLQITNPPVNGISSEVRLGLWKGIKYAQDNEAEAIVITGEGSSFSAGADIRQMNTPAANARPTLRDVVGLISRSKIPVIAAIHGYALGGALEVALGCHYRLSEGNAVIGLPEVNLGIIPGGGGTQRLPRLVRVTTALDIITTGRKIGAREALDYGLVDALFQDSPIDAGVRFVRSLSVGIEHPHVDFLNVQHPGAEVFEDFREKLDPKSPNIKAQLAAVDSVEISVNSQLEDGLDKERAIFESLVASSDSIALRHLFAAERAAQKVPHLPSQAQQKNVEAVAVIGAGTMGSGIAMACADNGINVRLIDVNDDGLARGRRLIRESYERAVKRNRITVAEKIEILNRISYEGDLDAVRTADLVIEAVYEDMELKKSVFRQLDKYSKSSAILASNTSRLDINEIARVTTRPTAVLGLHFFSPANKMRLLEVVRCDATDAQTLKTALNLAKKIGKVPVVVEVGEGFVGNRMLTPYWREAWFLLEEGATPLQVDEALEEFGMAMGPLATADLAGLDINWATRKRLSASRPSSLRYPLVADRICEAGRLGQKTHAGYYRYAPGGRVRIPDQTAQEIINSTSAELGIVRREIEAPEIIERCIYALINEGAKVLEEGIASSSSDIDVIYVNGYGFPAWRGGPMHYAEQIGLEAVLEKIREFHQQHGAVWEPAQLLIDLVEDGRESFSHAPAAKNLSVST